MKSFKQHIFEKLKVNTDKNSDPRDDKTVDMLSANSLDKHKFQSYLIDCIKRDKYNIQASDFEFHNSKVLYYYEKYLRSLCSYSVNDTYIELYDRIIDTLKEDHFIHEKLKVRTDTTITSDYRDDERLGDMSNLATGNNFLYYVYDCLKRDKVKDGGSGFIFGPTKDVISIIYKKFKRKIKYSPDETYIELYNRIIDVLREKHFITEKLKVSSNTEYTEYRLFPKSKDELKSMINDEISKNGNDCSLNHIDVSEIIDMSSLFYNCKSNVDISKWDVSNVTNMDSMFAYSKFNPDISRWDVSNVTTMYKMFQASAFNGDISDWDVSNVTTMERMFFGSEFTGENGDISEWDVLSVKDMSSMFYYSKFNGDISNWNVSGVTDMDYMFEYSPLQNNPPKWYK